MGKLESSINFECMIVYKFISFVRKIFKNFKKILKASEQACYIIKTTNVNKIQLGISLLEIVIAVVIVALAFIPILYAIQYGNKSTVRINNYAEVAKLAQGLIEECKHVPFKKIKEDYSALAANQWEIINPNYYPKTIQRLESLKNLIKNLEFNAELKVLKKDDIISEVWIRIYAKWLEGDTMNKVVRELRLANAISNPDLN